MPRPARPGQPLNQMALIRFAIKSTAAFEKVKALQAPPRPEL